MAKRIATASGAEQRAAHSQWARIKQIARRATKSGISHLAICPVCKNNVSMSQSVKVGQKVSCPHCHVELEVVDSNPVALGYQIY